MTNDSKFTWTDFTIELRQLDPLTWLKLGECASICSHLSHIPLPPVVSEQLSKVYLAKGVSATTAIEGNTLSEEEVRQAIDKTLEVPKSKEYLKHEVENIIEACNSITMSAFRFNDYKLDSNFELLSILNAQVLKNLPMPEEVRPGLLRNHNVTAGSYRPPDHSELQSLVTRYCKWLNSTDFQVDPDMGKEYHTTIGIIKAIVAHVYLVLIHPFGDGNGRTARLLEYHILIEASLPTPAAHLLSNHYNKTRSEYYRHLAMVSDEKPDGLYEFLSYAIQGLLDGLHEQLQYVNIHILNVCWRDYVHAIFRSFKSSSVNRRRRTLVLELSNRNEGVSIDSISTLTQKTIDYYRNLSMKAVKRDVEFLIDHKLLVKKDDGYHANKELILSFLPYSKK